MLESYISQLNCITRVNQDMKYLFLNLRVGVGWWLNYFVCKKLLMKTVKQPIRNLHLMGKFQSINVKGNLITWIKQFKAKHK